MTGKVQRDAKNKAISSELEKAHVRFHQISVQRNKFRGSQLNESHTCLASDRVSTIA